MATTTAKRPKTSDRMDRFKLADRLTKLAAGMEKEIQSKLDSATGRQRPTRRRLQIAEAMVRQGESLRKAQKLLQYVATHLRDGTLPEGLRFVVSKDTAISATRGYDGAGHRLTERQSADVAAALEGADQENADEKLRRLMRRVNEKAAWLRKAHEYFPTPDDLADKVAELARLFPGCTVLEPSAGTGALCDAVRARCPEARIQCIEPVGECREVLEHKGYELLPDSVGQMLEYHTEPTTIHHGHVDNPVQCGPYDRIVMNPPFSRGKDIEHVRMAWNLLKAGGVMVAIVSTGAMDRTGNKERQFQQFVHDHTNSVLRFNQSEFNESGTGVSTCMFALEKPGEDLVDAAAMCDATTPHPPKVPTFVVDEHRDPAEIGREIAASLRTALAEVDNLRGMLQWDFITTFPEPIAKLDDANWMEGICRTYHIDYSVEQGGWISSAEGDTVDWPEWYAVFIDELIGYAETAAQIEALLKAGFKLDKRQRPRLLTDQQRQELEKDLAECRDIPEGWLADYEFFFGEAAGAALRAHVGPKLKVEPAEAPELPQPILFDVARALAGENVLARPQRTKSTAATAERPATVAAIKGDQIGLF